MKPKSALLFLIASALFCFSSHAQFEVKTFGKYEKVKGGDPDKPTDFKTSFPLKSQVYVQLSMPTEPAFYTIDCFRVDENGNEKLTDGVDLKCFKKESGKTFTQSQALGMMYNAGNYRVKARRQSDNKIVAETAFTVTGVSTAPARTVAEVMFSDDTDDNFNPIKPTKAIKKGDGVNFSAKLKEGIGAKFFIWAVFEVKPDGDEVLFQDKQMNVDNETYRWFATTDKTYFTKPGTYAVYMLQQNATNSGMTVNKPTTYYARGVLEVK